MPVFLDDDAPEGLNRFLLTDGDDLFADNAEGPPNVFSPSRGRDTFFVMGLDAAILDAAGGIDQISIGSASLTPAQLVDPINVRITTVLNFELPDEIIIAHGANTPADVIEYVNGAPMLAEMSYQTAIVPSNIGGAALLIEKNGDLIWDYAIVFAVGTELNFTGVNIGLDDLSVEVSQTSEGVFEQVISLSAGGDGLSLQEAQTIAYLYEAGLNRNGDIDIPGLNFWIDIAESGFSQVEISQFFLDSLEFKITVGDPEALSDQELVEGLYLNVLDRPGEINGVGFWTSVVGQPNFSRADLLLAFAVSPENTENSPAVLDLLEFQPGEWAFV